MFKMVRNLINNRKNNFNYVIRAKTGSAKYFWNKFFFYIYIRHMHIEWTENKMYIYACGIYQIFYKIDADNTFLVTPFKTIYKLQ